MNEIARALRILCGANGRSCDGNCSSCPANKFRELHPGGACDDGTMTAAYGLIEQLQSEIKEYEASCDARDRMLCDKDAELTTLRASKLKLTLAKVDIDRSCHTCGLIGGWECPNRVRVATKELCNEHRKTCSSWKWRWDNEAAAPKEET